MEFMVKDMIVSSITSKVYTYRTLDNVELTAYNTDDTNTFDLTIVEYGENGTTHTWTVGAGEQLVKVFKPLDTVTITNTSGVTFKYIASVGV